MLISCVALVNQFYDEHFGSGRSPRLSTFEMTSSFDNDFEKKQVAMLLILFTTRYISDMSLFSPQSDLLTLHVAIPWLYIIPPVLSPAYHAERFRPTQRFVGQTLVLLQPWRLKLRIPLSQVSQLSHARIPVRTHLLNYHRIRPMRRIPESVALQAVRLGLYPHLALLDQQFGKNPVRSTREWDRKWSKPILD